MRGFLMAGWSIGVSIHLDQQEPRGILRFLQQIKAGYTRLLQTMAGIFDRGLAKGLHTLRFYLNRHLDNQHRLSNVFRESIWSSVLLPSHAPCVSHLPLLGGEGNRPTIQSPRPLGGEGQGEG